MVFYHNFLCVSTAKQDRNILLVSRVLCSVGASRPGVFVPVTSLSHWPLLIFGNLWLSEIYMVWSWYRYSLLAQGTTDLRPLTPLLPRARRTQFSPAAQLSCMLNLSCTFLFAELYCAGQAWQCPITRSPSVRQSTHKNPSNDSLLCMCRLYRGLCCWFCPGRLWSLLLWRYSRPAWTRSCAACSGWPCFGRGLDWVTHRGPFQPQPFCDSVITIFNCVALTNFSSLLLPYANY